MRSPLRMGLLVAGLLLAAPLRCGSAQDNATIDDRDISVVHFEELRYPALARTANVQGVVVVRVVLDDQGNVERTVGVSGNKVLLGDCLANAKGWKFKPNTHKSAVIVYNFTLKEASCGVVSSFFVFQGKNLVEVTSCVKTIDTTQKK